MPASRQPSMSSVFPTSFEVMKTTVCLMSTRNLLQTRPGGGIRLTLGTPGPARALDQLHRVRPTAAFARVPETAPLWADVPMDHGSNSCAEGLLLVRAYPDKIPIRVLQEIRSMLMSVPYAAMHFEPGCMLIVPRQSQCQCKRGYHACTTLKC